MKLQSCKKCSSENVGIGFYEIASGRIANPWVCRDCGFRHTIFASKKDLVDYHYLIIDDHFYKSKFQENCEVCGKLGAELHHYAPYYLFKEESNNWPTGYLCISCHRKWHALVTPNMSQKL